MSYRFINPILYQNCYSIELKPEYMIKKDIAPGVTEPKYTNFENVKTIVYAWF